MFRFSIVVAVSAFAMLLAASGAWATMENITIDDTMDNATWDGYVTGGEDQEVEIGMQTGQAWDLEAFFMDGNSLSMVGGWDFKNGLHDSNGWDAYSGGWWDSGDVFIATGGTDPLYGATAPSIGEGVTETNESFGYEFALVMNWANATEIDDYWSVDYDVISLTEGATLAVTQTVYDGHNEWNEGSNPYRWLSGGTEIEDAAGTATYRALGDDDYEGLTGGPHYSVTFDLSDASWLGTRTGLWTHFTQECGNDNVIGNKDDYTPVPEPFSMVMLGCLGAGMLGARKARQWRKAAK
jgi:hypothetical protein